MKKYIVLTLVILIGTVSCTDLDVIPKDGRALESIVFAEQDAYISYLAKVYASLTLTGQEGPAGSADLTIIADEGFSSYIRVYWKAQELTTDEAVIRWTDAGIQDLNTNSWSSDNQFVRVLYYRIYFTVALANDFLRVAETHGGVFDQNFTNQLEKFKAEARYIRAMAYWHALDLFRNVTLITEVGSALPSQVSPTELYNFILSELNEIEPLMTNANQGDYGRADKAALWMLRAKLKLNAPVYLPAGSVELDGIYDDVVSDLESFMSAGYSLNPNYLFNFNADNHTSPEMIFPLTVDGTNSQSWGSTTFLISGMIFSKEDTTDVGHMRPADWGMSGGWLGIRCTKNFVSLFETAPGTFTADGRQQFFTPGRTRDVPDILGQDNGYPSPKYSNIGSGGSAGNNNTFPDTDYPMFRLADAYLMYAEAVLRGGSGTRAAALGYINELLTRAYGDVSGNIVDADMTLDFILEERGRELYFEATRRQDLIRFNKYSARAGADEMVWEWKGNDVNGLSIPSKFEIFPIPATDLSANPNLVQNKDY
jgi:hypothetical protein